MTKEIRLNAFDMNGVGHIQHGMWTHPRDRSTEYNTIRYWQDLARLAERGKFDGIFLADIVGVYDVYRGGTAPSIVDAVQIPVNDPMMVVPVMAAVTEHIRFGVIANLTYEPPYLFARRMSTLDHLTGRPGQLEHRDRLSRQRGTRHGFDGPTRPRWPVRRRRRVHVRRLSVVGGELGRRRRAARQEEPYFRRSRQNPPRAALRAPLSGGCHSPVRAVAAADAGAVPGRLVESGPRVCRDARRVRLRLRGRQAHHPRSRRRHPQPGSDLWTRSEGHPNFLQPYRRRRPYPARGRGQVSRVPRTRQHRGRAGAFLELHRPRLLALRARRADPLCEEQCNQLE